ncbi:DUF4157 domain-containing protein [Aureispira sp. CCB-E]|uniref:eCIS core domain-containing protein n=1 Tax=Aureispira sp. CCB-E TaxID=3051121 RepID=UPI00286888AA|nr:DUF4157 domain-containing protein [Aureispira sp. CCB-E]WMX16027.1 DUF4157 domain-containing protein [Aureispira sp. CCB-E]
MAFEEEQIKEQQSSQNINDRQDTSNTNPTDTNPVNNNPPPPELNNNGESVRVHTKFIQVGESEIFTPSSHDELDDLVSKSLITETQKMLFVLKYEAWHGALPKTKDISKNDPQKEEGNKEQLIDLKSLLHSSENTDPQETEGEQIDLDSLRKHQSSSKGNVPQGLKNKIEQESGVLLDDVIIHYNSLEPFKFHANAFTRGNEIFLAPGQEKYLSEELWHVVQQKQGLVKPTGMENGEPVNNAPDLERLAKSGQAPIGLNKKDEKEQEVIQKNDDELTFLVVVKGKLSGKEWMILIENQIYGQVVNSSWKINGVSVDPTATIGEEGKTIRYHVTVPAAEYRRYRSQSTTGAGVEVDDKGAVKGASDRSKELEGLPKGTKDALIEEINRRFQEASGKAKKEAGDEALWNVYRDEVLAQREKIMNLSEKAKQLITIGEDNGGIVLSPKDYPKAIALIQKIEGLNDALVAEYASRVTGKATSIEQMEKSLDVFVKEQEERGQNKKKRTDIENELFATEGIFSDMQTFESLSIAGAMGGGAQASLTFYNKANDAAKKHGFKDLTDYENKTKEYLASFQQEAVATGVGLLQQYEHFLYKEEQRYLSTVDAKKLGDQVAQSGAKKKYAESDKNASYASMASMAMGTTTRSSEQVEKNIQGYRDKSKQQKAEATATMEGFGKDHPLLKDPAFDLKKLSQQSPEETKAFLLAYIQKQRENIANTKAKMQEDKEFVFTLDNLMKKMYEQEGISKGSIQDKVIQDHIGDIKLKDALISIGIALLAISLGLVSGGGGTVGVMAAVGGVGLSVYDVTREFGKYADEKAAHDVGLMSKDPSFAWVILAMVGVGLDFAAVAKLLKPLKAPVEGFNELAKTDPAKALSELEAKLAKIDGIDDKLKANILKRAEHKSEFWKKIRSTNMAQMQLVPGSKELLDLAVYAVKSGITRVEDFFNLLKKNGLKKSLGDLTPDETKALREALESAVTKNQLVESLPSMHYFDDLENMTLPSALGEGQDKITYALGTDRVISVLKETDPSVIIKEIQYMETLKGYNMPIGEILGITSVNGKPAMVMKRYAGSWKPTAFGTQDSHLLNLESIKSLEEIKRIITKEELFIDDLQFLIQKDGRLVVADPLGVKASSETPSIQIVNTAIEDAMTNIITSNISKNVNYTSDDLFNLLGNTVSRESFDEFLEMAAHPRVGFLSKSGSHYTLKPE